jgi:hypothetical protein
MLIAQSLVEYTSLSSFASTMESAAASVLYTLDHLTLQTWFVIGGMVVLTLLLFKARNRRRL